MTKNAFDYIIYTDGGCAVNPGGPGGYAAVIIDCSTGEVTEYSGGFASTTNNRMEVMATIVALEQIPDASCVQLYSDSQYLLNTMSGKWRKKKNADLWKRLDQASRTKTLDLVWVRGHNGDMYNERCDAMCTTAMRSSDLPTDAGYTLDPDQKPRASDVIKGAMGVSIELPEEFLVEPELLSVETYAEKYQVKNSCANAILAFLQSENRSFKSYMKLKTGGSDKWSHLKHDTLLNQQEELSSIYDYLEKVLPDTKTVESCLHWYCRGLPLQHAIRKALVDWEVAQNCLKKGGGKRC